MSGNYGDEGLECDAVFETATSIVFIEAKKKGLTRKALSGQAEAVLFDASQSVLEAQVQLARHEYSLRRDGHLSFHNGYQLRLDSRRVDRVAVTLLDLGSLQDKIVLGNMLTHLRGGRLHTDLELDEQGLRAKAAFERTADNLQKYFQLLRQLVADYDRLERFTVRSYSLCELMELLADVKGADDLAANIAIDRHLTTGVGDWYAEYHLLKSAPSKEA